MKKLIGEIRTGIFWKQMLLKVHALYPFSATAIHTLFFIKKKSRV